MRIVIGELGPVSFDIAARKEVVTARGLQVAVVDDDKSRVAGQVRPHVVMRGGIAELVDDEIVGVPRVPPDNVMRAERVRGTTRRMTAFGRFVREQVDVVPPRHPGQ